MDVVSGIILGVVQGLTEFLPVSSSGHLILAREILGLQTQNGLTVDAILQLATILAVGIYFWKDFVRLAQAALRLIARKPVEDQTRTLLFAILVGTVPALVAGLFLEHTMETIFRSATLVAITLLLGSALFWIAEKRAKQDSSISVRTGLLIGLFQVLALVPGISRSGATISGGLLLGLSRETAARFSFLLSFPIILGSGLKKLLDLYKDQSFQSMEWPLLISFITAFVVGIFCIHFLLRFLKRHTLNIFIVYRVVLAVIVLAVVWIV